MSLRTDERSWLIYDDESVGAFVRALEAYALSVVGQRLSRRPEVQLRAVGNLMMRIGEQRGWEMMKNDGAQREAVELLSRMAAHVAGLNVDDLQMLEDVHALAVWIDRRARNAGMAGPGVVREAVRGD